MRIGIVGGTGQLGRAMATAWLETRTVLAENLWIANRSGSLGPLRRWPEIRTTTRAQDLCETCEVIVLALPPAEARSLRLGAGRNLILSVMAGVRLAELAALTASPRIVRAMSSPAAAQRLAFSPWLAMSPLTEADTASVTRLLSACGLAEHVGSEDQIDRFTALTGPVPGFVAAFAEAMIAHARKNGIPEATAERAIRQLFLAAGTMMALDETPPATHVQDMIDYAGTTAAGLTALRDGPFARCVDEALEAAYQRTRTI
jgi:pyrroline-5-carboxylate reductase